MMEQITFERAVETAMIHDPSYSAGAYDFVRDVLHFTSKKFRGENEDQHVSGQELLEGTRLLALQEFGPMAMTLLEGWGLRRGEDIGRVVYNLIEVGYFGRNEGDSLEDFAGGYSFHDAFVRPFEPRRSVNTKR
jgi:uncharacterized repeat protein (TIGR04138 family)